MRSLDLFRVIRHVSPLRAALIAGVLLVPVVAHGQSGVVDPCKSTAAILSGGIPGAPGAVFICPAGDGQTLLDVGVSIVVAARDFNNNPIAAIPPADFWLDGCFVSLGLCFGSASSNADTITDASGMTTFSMDTIRGGGHAEQVVVVVQGVTIAEFDCSGPLCLPLTVKSADFNADLAVDLPDLAAFAMGFPSPPLPLEPPFDFDNDGLVGLADLAAFAIHFGHVCGLP